MKYVFIAFIVAIVVMGLTGASNEGKMFNVNEQFFNRR